MVLNRNQSNWTQPRMPVAHRAKQFAPFAALHALPDALAKKEAIRVPQRTLTECAAEELDRRLHWLRVGQKVTVVYYAVNRRIQTGEYLQLTGLVSRFSLDRRYLTVVNTVIPFADLYALRFDDGHGGTY